MPHTVLVVPNPKFAHTCCEHCCELRIQRDTRNHSVASVALVQKFPPDLAASNGELLNRHTSRQVRKSRRVPVGELSFQYIQSVLYN